MVLWAERFKMLNFLRRTSLYILAVPFLFTLLGSASNKLVIATNHDKFPVMVNDAKLFEYQHKLTEEAQSDDEDLAEHAAVKLEELEHGYLDDTHVIMTKSTHLNFLADIFDLRDGIYSIGDFLIMLGEWLGSFSIYLFVFATAIKLSGNRSRFDVD
jgi:hypothetical protein